MATKAVKTIDAVEIPLLEAADVEVRVGQAGITKSGAWASLLLYKDARVDMRILDLVFGPMNWQRGHEIIGGNLYCAILVYDKEKDGWVSKADVGTESNQDKEKGQASDSFKRAGVNWGIGRELYTAPRIFIQLNEGEYIAEGNKAKVNYSTRFDVQSIGYNDRREINQLVIVDTKGAKRFSFGALPQPQGLPPAPPKESAQGNVSEGENKPTIESFAACPHCKGSISVAEVEYSIKKYKKPLCKKCQAAYLAALAAKEKGAEGQK